MGSGESLGGEGGEGEFWREREMGGAREAREERERTEERHESERERARKFERVFLGFLNGEEGGRVVTWRAERGPRYRVLGERRVSCGVRRGMGAN